MNTPSPRLAAALEDRYRIERGLGEGGMATVYLARDLRHDRLVALKVLRPELAAVIGAQRFLAEIKTTANLQHPHILPLHDSGEADGTVFYVMPFVEGETLRDRIRHEKQLPVDEAIRIAREVASALDYAHRHGVVHRDIKPENILLHDGQALVADFGISLAVTQAEGGTRMTETGMSLGTPHYMAPEQAMGEREITARADIYALGCVTYEMLTGEPPFTGTTAQAIVARAMTESPRRITIQRHTVPVHVEATVMKALEKLPADRFASASEFAEALENPALTLSATAPLAAGGMTKAAGRRARAAMPLGALALVALIAFAWALLRPAPPAPVSRYAIEFPRSASPNPDRGLAVSPDGENLLYVGPGEGDQTRLWLKARDRERALPLAGTENVAAFTFSPDGAWIAFISPSTNEVRKMPVIGGAALPLAGGAQATRGIAWLDDGTIVYPATGAQSLLRVPDVGGPPTVVWRADSAATTSTYFPTALRGSRGILFTRCEGGASCPGGIDLWTLDLKSRESRLLVAGAVRSFPTPTGQLVYVRPDGGALSMPFDPRTLRAGGAAIPVQDSIALGVNLIPLFALSEEGSLFTRTGGSAATLPPYELVWVDRAGNEAVVDTSFIFRNVAFGANAGWALSPDGTLLAIGQNVQGSDHVWVKQLPRGPASRITFDSNPSFRPRWSRDGRSVIYISSRAGNAKMYKRAADGTGSETLVYGVPQSPGLFEGGWTTDEKSLALRAGGQVSVSGGRDILIARPGVDSVPAPLIADPKFDESAIAISPDGHWIAYESDETTRKEVYIRPFPEVNGGKWQVSAAGGRAPLWSRNGRELFFVDASRQMVVASVGPGAAPQLGERRILFRMRPELYLAEAEQYTPFDISPDGRRFIMARRVSTIETPTSPLVVTEHWFEELKRLVGKR